MHTHVNLLKSSPTPRGMFFGALREGWADRFLYECANKWKLHTLDLVIPGNMRAAPRCSGSPSFSQTQPTFIRLGHFVQEIMIPPAAADSPSR